MWILTSMLGFQKEQYGSLEGLDLSIDGVDISLFLNSLDIIFCQSKLVLLSLLQCYENKRLCRLNCLLHVSIKPPPPPLGPLELTRHLGHLLGHLQKTPKIKSLIFYYFSSIHNLSSYVFVIISVCYSNKTFRFQNSLAYPPVLLTDFADCAKSARSTL